jgi:tRNA 2-thiocytidine biosynthesis protein TtcA
LKKTLGCIRRADEDWGLFKQGDRVAVGVSGGKDSMLLLYALHLYRKFKKTDFSIHAITLKLGFEPFDISPIQALCHELGIPYTCIDTDIADVVFHIRKEKNPCSLCAKMRRGVLHDAAKAQGCNVLALGHSSDDVLETFLLSMFFEARLNTFSPISYLSRKDLLLTRPFAYLPEKHIISAVHRLQLPVVHNPCPANGASKRQDMKQLLTYMSEVIPGVKERILHALMHDEHYALWNKQALIGRLELLPHDTLHRAHTNANPQEREG